MLTTMFVAIACFAPETNLTADAIMQRVIENQIRAQEARKQWVLEVTR